MKITKHDDHDHFPFPCVQTQDDLRWLWPLCYCDFSKKSLISCPLISGIDPARPLVDRYGDKAFRLTRDDANFVQVSIYLFIRLLIFVKSEPLGSKILSLEKNSVLVRI